MDKFGDRLKNARKAKNLSQEMLGKLIGVTRNAITNYEKNSNTPTYENMKKLSLILGVDLSDEKKQVKFVPIVGTASCGGSEIDFLQEDNSEGMISTKYWKNSLYCVIANGDSMAPLIENNAEVFIDPTKKYISGVPVYYKLDNESAIKILFIDEEAHIMQFVPINQSESFKTKTIRLDDQETLDKLTIHCVHKISNPDGFNRSAILKMIGR